ncbi:hypothetical protein ACFX1W_018185 [Malus domestica]
MGPRRSTRLNVTISGAAPPPRGPTVAATIGEAHGTMPPKPTQAQAQAVPSKAHSTKATAQVVSLQSARAQHIAEPNQGPSPTRVARGTAHYRGPTHSRGAPSRGG